MPKRKESNAEELAASRDTRVLIARLSQHEMYMSLLRHAQRIRLNSGGSDTLADVIESGTNELQSLHAQATGRVHRRRRPHKSDNDPDNTCRVFIDECGSSTLDARDLFKAFVVSAVIIPDNTYAQVDETWKKWKSNKLGSRRKVIHEPDVRRGIGPFYFNKNFKKRKEVVTSLNQMIGELDFIAVACVVNSVDYVARVGTGAYDSSLPSSPYLMVLDFLLERIVMILDTHCNGAKAHVVAEARGPLEDAMLQYEYVRLQLDGTSYISPAWFRHQLSPAIEFRTKKDNITGLQIVDLLARPCGEKVLSPSTTPDRWPEFRAKLCPGKETEHSILGFKIVPWDPCYDGIWES